MSASNRNRPCGCGSSRKFKKCCGHPIAMQKAAEEAERQRRIAYTEKLAKERQGVDRVAKRMLPLFAAMAAAMGSEVFVLKNRKGPQP